MAHTDVATFLADKAVVQRVGFTTHTQLRCVLDLNIIPRDGSTRGVGGEHPLPQLGSRPELRGNGGVEIFTKMCKKTKILRAWHKLFLDGLLTATGSSYFLDPSLMILKAECCLNWKK